MCFGQEATPLRRMTREQAAKELSALLCSCGIYATPGVLVEAFTKHWSRLAPLAHAIHDDWKPVRTAYDAAMQDRQR